MFQEADEIKNYSVECQRQAGHGNYDSWALKTGCGRNVETDKKDDLEAKDKIPEPLIGMWKEEFC